MGLLKSSAIGFADVSKQGIVDNNLVEFILFLILL